MSAADRPRIRRLPAVLSNQIAAGEVIERPASVMKELLENGVDAGATRLDIDVEQGGIASIRVRDDGAGIHRDDLVLALSRHATSKVSSLADLEAVRSLGFRGEALPSIASVARLEICSRLAAETNAWELAVDGSEVNAFPRPASHPVGTTVTVRDLFFNTPARRKFLRTEKTELRHVEDVVRRVALSRLDIEVRLRHNARSVWTLPSAGDETGVSRRISRLCGVSFHEHALRIDFESGDLRLGGWLAAPGFGRRQSDLQYFFLNGRMVRDRVVNHAIRQAYEETLTPGEQPAFVLYLEIDPSRVDVNVHPAKHEVRFRDSRLVHDFLFRALQRALSAHRDPVLDLGEAATDRFRDGASRTGSAPTVSEQLGIYAFSGPRSDRGITRSPETGDPAVTPLAVIGGRYLLSRSGEFVTVIDLVVAVYRDAHLRLSRAVEEGTVRTRPLLVPVNCTVTQEQASLIDSAGETLSAVGIEIRQLGPEIVSLRQIPVPLEHAAPSGLIAAVLGFLSERPAASGSERLLAALAHSAAETPPGDPASLRELLHRLQTADMDPFRPGFSRPLGVDELAGLFPKER